MTRLILSQGAVLPVAVALGASALMLVFERGSRASALGPLVLLVPLALVVAGFAGAGLGTAAVVIGLVIAILARTREDLLHSECAIKLLWVMGTALALSWAGVELLLLSTGTGQVREQWAVLELGLDPRVVWSTALSLSLLIGLVLLGGAPFHFWAADLLQGARQWLAPLAVAALQVTGARWLMARLDGIEAFPAGARGVSSLLGLAALVALIAGAATLAVQRRPERRVGTLASLNGALILAWLVTGHGVSRLGDEKLSLWAAHLVLALSGAGPLARFVPVSSRIAAPGPVLFRRHPLSGILGLYALFSLAGAPGTPGAWIWLDVARGLASAGQDWLLLALGMAWVAAFSAAVRQLREAFGIRVETAPPAQPVAWQARVAMAIAAVALVLVGARGWLG
jgi:NADH:ubiquinone oxidoreductase subunit 2 (subunit N)